LGDENGVGKTRLGKGRIKKLGRPLTPKGKRVRKMMKELGISEVMAWRIVNQARNKAHRELLIRDVMG